MDRHPGRNRQGRPCVCNSSWVCVCFISEAALHLSNTGGGKPQQHPEGLFGSLEKLSTEAIANLRTGGSEPCIRPIKRVKEHPAIWDKTPESCTCHHKKSMLPPVEYPFHADRYCLSITFVQRTAARFRGVPRLCSLGVPAKHQDLNNEQQ